MTNNELMTLAGPIIDRLHDENDHTAAIIMSELCDQLRSAGAVMTPVRVDPTRDVLDAVSRMSMPAYAASPRQPRG